MRNTLKNLEIKNRLRKEIPLDIDDAEASGAYSDEEEWTNELTHHLGDAIKDIDILLARIKKLKNESSKTAS